MRSVRRAQTLRKRGHGGSEYGSRFPSESQPSAKLVERHHDVLAIGGPRRQPLIPGFYIGNGRALQIEPQVAAERRTRGHVGHGEAVAGKVWPLRQLSIEQPVVASAALDQFAKARPVALIVGGAIVAPE